MPWFHFKITQDYITSIEDYRWYDEDFFSKVPKERKREIQFEFELWTERRHLETFKKIICDEIERPPLEVLKQKLKNVQSKIIRNLEMAETFERQIEESTKKEKR
jgi:hypothetical protein